MMAFNEKPLKNEKKNVKERSRKNFRMMTQTEVQKKPAIKTKRKNELNTNTLMLKH